jgi:thymidylate synthase (FAD)
MQVKLVSYTKPSDELVIEGLEDLQDLIAFCARVSNPNNQYNTETTDKLLNYLLGHKHFSPFEMVNACLEITTTRDIARQILRHRSFTFQEFSQRYADPTKDLDFVIREARLQDVKNRQNSIETDDDSLQNRWAKYQQNVITEARMAYKWAIENGIAKEQARAVLPEGNTVSRLYVNGTIRSWLHYISVRKDISTQKEHREIALACANVISCVFPLINN